MPQIVAGVDEAGRGALAGPVVAGAVILPRDFPSDFFFDSKILTEKKREEIFEWISANADFGFGEVSAEEIDRIGIKKATNEAMRRAVSTLKTTPDLLKIDGNDRFSFSLPSEDFVRGDALYPEISASSVRFCHASRMGCILWAMSETFDADIFSPNIVWMTVSIFRVESPLVKSSSASSEHFSDWCRATSRRRGEKFPFRSRGMRMSSFP